METDGVAYEGIGCRQSAFLPFSSQEPSRACLRALLWGLGKSVPFASKIGSRGCPFGHPSEFSRLGESALATFFRWEPVEGRKGTPRLFRRVVTSQGRADLGCREGRGGNSRSS